MAIGSQPTYTATIPFDGLNREQFLVIAVDAATELQWTISYISLSGFIAVTENGMFNWNADVTLKTESSSAMIKSSSENNERFDWGRNRGTAVKFREMIDRLRPNYTVNELATKYSALLASIDQNEPDLLQIPEKTTREKFTDFVALFKPADGYLFTPIFIYVNVIVFLCMAFSGMDILKPDHETLLKWGANCRPLTLDGEWWRLFTSFFVHIGILHLVMNMYALLYIGVLLEPLLGKARFFAAYILTGLAAGVVSLAWYNFSISAGASGAIFGLYGVFLALLMGGAVPKSTKTSLILSVVYLVAYNLLNGRKEGIDNAAHIGGLISGFVIGLGFLPSLKHPGVVGLKSITIAALAVCVVGCSSLIYDRIPNDIITYEKNFAKIKTMDSLAQEVLRLPDTTAKERTLHAIKEVAIYNSEKIMEVLDESEELELPDIMKKHLEKLKVYGDLRLKSYELMYKAVDENTEKYNKQIKLYDDQIDKVWKKKDDQPQPD